VSPEVTKSLSYEGLKFPRRWRSNSWFSVSLRFNPEDGGSTVLRNISIQPSPFKSFSCSFSPSSQVTLLLRN